MKRNWEYKKLGDVCDYPNQRIAIKDLCVGEYVGVENLVKNRGGLIQSTVMPDADNSIEFHVGDVLIGNIRPYLRKIWLADFNGGASGDVVVVRVKKEFGNKLQPSYLYKVLSSEKFFEYDNSNTKGAKMPRGDRNIIAKYLIPIPPLSEQSRIVAELDLLTGIIDKQNAQLKELDNLAQAIFYDMFGDPIENPKGWNLEKLNNVSTLVNGRAYKQNELLDNGKYKVLRVGNFFTNGNYYYSDLELEKEKYCEKGDLLFAWSASFGAFIWQGEKVIYHYHIWKVLFDKKKLDIQYYRFLLNAMTNFFMKDVHGIGMVHLTKEGMEQYILPLPPLTLQQSFAEKIQSIEKQKEAIRASIADTQKLLDYTMDKYFG